MPTGTKFFPNHYRDSVALMRMSAEIAGLPGIDEASFVMATEANIALVVEAGLLDKGPDPRPNDLMGVVIGSGADGIEAAFDAAGEALASTEGAGGGAVDAVLPRTLDAALDGAPTSNLALISCPGEYAGAEAMKALRLGLNAMIFSDNVPVEDEIALKSFAAGNDLLVMGPDCGTAIIDGVPLGFANRVRRGGIGVIGASGTGTQEVTCQIDRRGGGVSQAIGTGGRDLDERIGGVTMLKALDLLAADPDTGVIALVSKPPAPTVAARILEKAAAAGKPVIVNFLGWQGDRSAYPSLTFAGCLEETAHLAVAAGDSDLPSFEIGPMPSPVSANGHCLRGLFSGGTFCYEALLELTPVLGDVWSTSPVDKSLTLNDPWTSQGHTVIDLGDDLFTRGRPHPMIDHGLRNERIIKEAGDPSTAVVLLDVVLGYGADMDPANAMLPAIAEARELADSDNRRINFVASVCGTSRDPQNPDRQESALRDAGVRLAPSNVQAARLAATVLAETAGGAS